ncbi:hypothetical protein THC_1726 [Caldimicrobium thiodismutans]|uniref:Prepilin-type cleavage/methylation domain-containing protein n=1 Tax=Caldimicrobium thiodismutans TaxID=1653476 RepID=A0A0U4N466_9BACT|nr:prepilin-type N-terminal cleavage/methylation domain-containing protein [Caldimicrobium thiodismutans]BAU24086.1 hypothetical protein THC_1726 [Caldimicrobium thiodismutans]
MKERAKGFTLVELAIVLVIIGIILGAVLKGQELIANARAKRVQNDLRGLEAIIWTYYDRRGNLPGDTNNDGIIDDPTNATAELVAQGLLPNGTNGIRHAFGGNFTIGNFTTNNATFNAITIDNIPSFAAQMIDTSIDGSANGLAGRFRRADNTTADWPTTDPNSIVTARYFFDKQP